MYFAFGEVSRSRASVPLAGLAVNQVANEKRGPEEGPLNGDKFARLVERIYLLAVLVLGAALAADFFSFAAFAAAFLASFWAFRSARPCSKADFN